MQMRPMRYDPTPLGGGLDMASTPLEVRPGRCIAASNFEPGPTGVGYRRMAGIERYDGRIKPSNADYYVATCNISGTVTAGDTLVGMVSAATAVVIAVVSSSRIILTKVAGTFVAETFTASNTTPLPDVVVSDIFYAAGVFSCTVINQGAAATPADKSIGVAYSADGNSATWGSSPGPLAAGASVTIGSSGGGPYVLASGVHTVTAEVEDANRFVESSETNNTLSKLINVGGVGTAPTVSVTAPTGGSIVTGSSIAITASASDDVGVSGVQFKIDGVNLGAEVTVAPYAVTWDSTTVTGGPHTITAVARDADGNTTTSAGVTVTVAQGTVATVTLDAEVSIALHAEYKNLAADQYRVDILKPTGEGAIRGVVTYAGNDYCFRNNVGSTACIMYKATASGWVAVPLGREIGFTNSVGEIFEGQTVTGLTSSASAVVKRALLRTGTWTVSGVGTLVFDTVTGVFASGEALQVGGVTKATSATVDTAVALLPSGKFEFDLGSFSGTNDSDRLYCVDGVNIPGEFDGFRWAPIRTGTVSAAPKYVRIHRKHLIFANANEIITSGTGTPYSYTALTGASRLLVDQDITGMMAETGDPTTGALTVTTNGKIYILYGTSTADFNLTVHSPNSGAKAYTLQSIVTTHFLDDYGISNIYSAQQFGNFQVKGLTNDIQPLMQSKQGKAVASCVIRQSNQYRLFFNDGTGIILQVSARGGNRQLSFMFFDYGTRTLNVVYSSVTVGGSERVLAGGDDGYVYELGVGTSFDGDNIRAFLALQFNHSGSVRVRKQYVRTVLQLKPDGVVNVQCGSDFGFGRVEVRQSAAENRTVLGAGGYWDSIISGEYTWDGGLLQEIHVNTAGIGDSVALFISGDTDTNPPYNITACIPYYKIGRFDR